MYGRNKNPSLPQKRKILKLFFFVNLAYNISTSRSVLSRFNPNIPPINSGKKKEKKGSGHKMAGSSKLVPALAGR